MNRPESLLAAGALGLVATVAVLLYLSLASCESGSRSGWAPLGETGRGVWAGGQGGLMDPAVAPHRGPVVAVPPEHFGPRGPDLRVRIRTAVDKVVLGGSEEAMFWPGAPGGERSPLLSAGEVEITLEGGRFALRSSEGVAYANASTSVWASAAAKPGMGGVIAVEGVDHPGRVTLAPRPDVSSSAFDVIEYVALEDYLPGVVQKEMLAGWPLGAFQVQAVCARTYALHERSLSLRRGERFDLENSDRDQVYSGASRNATVLEAVRSTRGMVLIDGEDGEVLRAYFSSTCGGRTASAKDTWPTRPGYEYNLAKPIQAHARESACEKSPLFRWTVVRDRDELARRIRAFGERQNLLVRKLKSLHSIEPMTFNEDDRPNKYKVIEPGGTWYALSGEEIRLACNNSVPAVAPVVGGVGASPDGAAGLPGLPLVDRKQRVHSSDFTVRSTRDGMIFTGRGFGHGVGMCQYCAKGFAERGEDWRTNVLRFYPGAKLKQLY